MTALLKAIIATTEQKKDIEASVTDGGTLILEFRHGERLAVRPDDLTPEIQRAAMLHGLKQKLVDAAAISRDPTTGRAATIATKYDAVKEVFDRITGDAPSWNKPREGSGGGGGGGLLFRALCRMYAGRQTPEAVRSYLDRLTDKQKQALRVDFRVAKIIEEIRAESDRPTGVNTDALLAGLGALDNDNDNDND